LKVLSLIVSIAKSGRLQYLWVFLAAVSVRAIPELLVPLYPVGYETITWYAPVMMTFKSQTFASVFQSTFMAGPLFYTLMWLVTTTTSAHPFVILKITAPLLYGGLAMSFLLFSKRGLKFDGKMAFVATLLMVFQVAALRESWDRFRTVLALVFLFMTLASLRSNHRNKWVLVAILAVLTALSREYISVVLLVTILGFAVLERRDILTSIVAMLPALAVTAIMVSGTGLWWNYVGGGAPTFYSETYLGVVLDVFLIFAVCFLPISYFVLKGFRRDSLLDPVFALLLLGSFGAVVFPWFAIPGYQRWLILLVYPFSIYAVFGFEHLQLFTVRKIKTLTAVLLIFMLLGVGYASSVLSYVVLPSSWVPPSLVKSSVEWNQVDDVKETLRWLDGNAPASSALLTEERFYGWILIYLKRANNDIEIVPYGGGAQPTSALQQALNDDFSWIYLIWYTNSSFDKFNLVYSQDSISVFRYELASNG